MTTKRATPEQRIQIRKLAWAKQSVALIADMLGLPKAEVREVLASTKAQP